MKTEFFVDYNLYDTTALQDGVESTGSNAAFADIGLIKNNVSAPSYEMCIRDRYMEMLYMVCRGFEYSEQQKAGQEEKRKTE